MGTLLFDDLEKPYEALPFFEKAFELDEICVQPLRRIIQIRSRFPPPAGVEEADWRGPVKGLEKNLAEGVERRQKALKERRDKTGTDGCE